MVVLVLEVDDGELFLLTVASMFVPSFHLCCWRLLLLSLLSSGKEFKTIGSWGRKLPIGSESMDSQPRLIINTKKEKREREIERRSL